MITKKLLNLNKVRFFSSLIQNIPIIEAGALLENTPEKEEQCRAALDSMHKYGIMIVRDPRIDEQKNQDFLDMMESYYESKSKLYYNEGILDDARPESGYQCGILPELQEKARDHSKTLENFPHFDKPVTSQPPPKDGKWRFMWRVGGEKEIEHSILPDNVVPEDFPQWTETMDDFGNSLMQCSYTASEMLAVGLGWPQDTLRNMMEGGTQLLGPTGSDLSKYTNVGDILAGFHYGLYIWLRTGERVPVKVPDGCFLIQAAKQAEILTGGYIFAGFHEVLVDENVLEAAEKARQDGRSLWRVSSTMFSSIRYDKILEPLNQFNTEENLRNYPSILTADQVTEELSSIDLLEN